MPHYLVGAHIRPRLIPQLEASLQAGEIEAMRPFGRALYVALRSARLDSQGLARWEEEDYCDPPLREERVAVLDYYFEGIFVQRVDPGAGWTQISALPFLFPSLVVPSARERYARESFSWLRSARSASRSSRT